MEKLLHVFLLEPAKEYLEEIPPADSGAITRDMQALAMNRIDDVHTKQLKGPIRELKSGHHRISYFKLGSTLYFIRGFRKKSAKAPKREIEYAEKIYKLMKTKQ